MDIGTKVKVRGTQIVGVIISQDNRRVQSSTPKIFYMVRHEDGKEMEYGIEELRTWEDESYKRG